MMRLQDLARCCGPQVDEDGTPRAELVAVDLDGAGQEAIDVAIASLEREPGRVVVGTATRPIAQEAYPLLRALTCTIAAGSAEDEDQQADEAVVFVPDVGASLAAMGRTLHRCPVASSVLAQVLQACEATSVEQGLLVESWAYSTLLAGGEFSEWRRSHPASPPLYSDSAVAVRRIGDELDVQLNCPERHNAFGRDVRDGLLEALAVAAADPRLTVRLRGVGPSFCAGGHLGEFGSTADVALGHLIRSTHSTALQVHRLADRVTVEVHGACIGAGIEVPSFAHRLVAHDDAWFQLPELQMGLIPGAGGTVGVTRRIGRWRTAFLALTAEPIGITEALRWGLVDERA